MARRARARTARARPATRGRGGAGRLASGTALGDNPGMDRLPIDDALPELLDALRREGRAVLEAPPGAGKTTRVPLAVLEAGLSPGRIVMLEPRRVAARAAAERMAESLGEAPGATVGYRMRGASRDSERTRILVVTEGILTRMLQSDPGLEDIGTVIFDEIHERSLAGDLGLALTWEARETLRPDLLLLAMSATLDAAPLAALLGDAPRVSAPGRSFPVERHWLERPLPPGGRLEAATADLALRALSETEGDVLVFLPGEGEIRRCIASLAGRLPPQTDALPLYGSLPARAQRAALAPAPPGRRKLVLATSIAETSLTLPGVRAVVDAGRARRARFDPGSGMSRLVTERVTRAEAEQRAGRAGRTAPGHAYRLWTRGEEGGLAAYPPAEIEAADLAGLALELALWGSSPEDLAFLTPPPAAALAEARDLLARLGALDGAGRVTAHGRAMAALPLHPRLAHMLLRCGPAAAPLAALMEDRDLLRGAPADLSLRLDALAGRPGNYPAAPEALERLRAGAGRLARLLRGSGPAQDARSGAQLAPAEMAALAYPDRIALRRPGDAPRYLLSGGKGAALDAADPLANARLLVATDLDGDPREARIRQALPLSDAGLRALFGREIAWEETCRWSRRRGAVIARRRERFGALVLAEQPWPDAPADALARAALEGLRDIGLPLGPAARSFAARVELARADGLDLPPSDPASLLENAEDWLLPYLSACRTTADLRRLDLLPALRARLDWGQMQALDHAVPARFETPLGRSVAIDYTGDEGPAVALRLQELFGITAHPRVGGRPLRITLLSPAGRPVQTTSDLPGFWASSYADVRKDMRGRYPKHPWPEDPTEAAPTLRAKPRR
jgi:ATP-dependent helicase HrpB